MEKKINIIEIIKDCPIGTKLYSPLCGECRVSHIYDGLSFDVICGDDTVYNFSYDGRYNIMGECCIFPSKENRDWSKFQRPFKDGDIIYFITENDNEYIFILKNTTDVYVETYVDIAIITSKCSLDTSFYADNIKYQRLATKEEKEKLFDAIKAKGYRWNEENKILEKLVKPNFKAGNKIEKYGYRYTITEVKDDYYLTKCGNKIPIDYQDGFSLVPNKFDITTLKPFDKVLVRLNNSYWKIQFFERINKKNKNYPFVCMYGHNYKQCIPYEGNEHLLNTANDCDEFYKTW